MTKKLYTPAERVAELVEKYGSYRDAAAATGIDHSRLWRIAKGRMGARGVTLDRLGLDGKKTYHERLTSGPV